MIMLESLKAFAEETQPQAEVISDEYTLDEISFKKLFRQIFTLAERYKDVPHGENMKYWDDFVKDISTLSHDWELHDAEGNVIRDQETGGIKFHPLFFQLTCGILDGYSDIWKARRA